MTDTSIEGDWYLQIGEQDPDPATLPRYTLRAGRVFAGTSAAPIGVYTIGTDTAKIALGDNELLTVRLPAAPADYLSGTLTSTAAPGELISDPALLLRAIADTPTH